MEHCKQEATIKDLVEAKGRSEATLKSIERIVLDIKDNHLGTIYKKIDCVIKKISGRPSWTVCTIITILTALVAVLLREVLR